MEFFHIFSAVLVLSAFFAYLNHRYVRLPMGIGLMVAGLLLSLLLLAVGNVAPGMVESVQGLLLELDFSTFVLDFLLSFLLFAGALHTDLSTLREVRWPVLVFATIGVVISALLVGSGLYFLLHAFDIGIPFIHCLLFGTLIAPTDPIAVLGILRQVGVSERIEAKITGESLFNDGIGVVLFLSVLGVAMGSSEASAGAVGELLAVEVGGGLILGFVLGGIGFYLMRNIDHYRTEVLITIAIVMGGYSLAQLFHLSGPLAMVVAGLFIGNKGHKYAMSDITADYINKFWEMLDEVLNAVLFVLIGLELLVVPFKGIWLLLGVAAAVLVVGSRYISLALPSYLLGFRKTFSPNTLPIMTWGGLKGGISIALALSLPPELSRALLLNLTYVAVLLSLGVQGLTLKSLVKRLAPKLDE